MRVPTRQALILAPLALGVSLARCGSEPPALTVGPAAYTEDQLLGLSDARRRTLALITAYGLAAADSATAELGAPVVGGWVDDRLLDVLAAELTLERHDVGDDVLEARYLGSPRWELTVRHILFFSERWRDAAHRAEAKAKAERALELLKGGADFTETAARLSEEPGAEGRQGLLTPGREGSWVPEFWAAALALEPGGISPVTETQYGYHILRLENRRIVPFDEARSTVARDVADRLEDPRAVLSEWLDATGVSGDAERRSAALAEARRRGLEVPEAERAEIARRWDDVTQRWSAALGFMAGLSTAQVTEASLAALANSAQGAAIARNELEQRADLLEARYPITLGSAAGS